MYWNEMKISFQILLSVMGCEDCEHVSKIYFLFDSVRAISSRIGNGYCSGVMIRKCSP